MRLHSCPAQSVQIPRAVRNNDGNENEILILAVLLCIITSEGVHTYWQLWQPAEIQQLVLHCFVCTLLSHQDIRSLSSRLLNTACSEMRVLCSCCCADLTRQFSSSLHFLQLRYFLTETTENNLTVKRTHVFCQSWLIYYACNKSRYSAGIRTWFNQLGSRSETSRLLGRKYETLKAKHVVQRDVVESIGERQACGYCKDESIANANQA